MNITFKMHTTMNDYDENLFIEAECTYFGAYNMKEVMLVVEHWIKINMINVMVKVEKCRCKTGQRKENNGK